jgi:hypothetical protein
MKTVSLIILMISLPSAIHPAACAVENHHTDLIQHDDLTPPIYIPGTPVRYNIPIYDVHTREVIATASSVYAYDMYVQMNGLPHALLLLNDPLQ